MKKRTHKLSVSVIVTIFNEELSLPSLLDSLFAQTLPPTDIVIVDGGSTDITWQILERYAKTYPTLKIFRCPGNRSVGRNCAISHAKGEIIAITDAGCIPHHDWLEELVKPFYDNSHTLVVSGYYDAKAQTVFQKCLIPYVLVMPDKADKTEFFPATRSMALHISVWQHLAKFNEHLNHNEDYAYAHTLKSHGINFVFAPNAKVTWLPRQNLQAAAWMFCRFAIGDMQAGIIRPKVKMLAIRYLIFVYVIFLSHSFPILIPLLALVALAYLIWAILKNFKYVKDIRAVFWLPTLQITADLSVLFGSLVGVLSQAFLR